MLIKFMFLSSFTFIGSYYFENHLCDVMRTHYSTQGNPVTLYQCYEMLAFLLATLIIYQQVLRADKSGQMWKEVSLVPRLSHCPVCDHLSKFHQTYKAVLPVEGNTQLLPFASAVSTHNFAFINDLSSYRPIT